MFLNGLAGWTREDGMFTSDGVLNALPALPPVRMRYASQALSTIPGQDFHLTFRLTTPSGHNAFVVALDPAPAAFELSSAEGPPNAPQLTQLDAATLSLPQTQIGYGWTKYQVGFKAAAAPTTLKLGFQINDEQYGFMVGDVSVQYAPQACTLDGDCDTGLYCNAGICAACSNTRPHW